MSEIVNLEPRIVWEQFDAITQVPRPSKKEGKIIEFLVDFARKHNIEYKKDAIGNVVMRKPATPGFEDRPAVILQSHMDMVCEKNSDVEFDFDNDPIRTRIDGVNLCSAVRAHRLRKGPDFLHKVLLEGGSVPPAALEEAAPADLRELYAATPLREAAGLAEGICAGGGSMTALEKQCDNAVLRLAAKARRTPFGVETALGYLIAAEAELTAVRTIMTGRRAGLSADAIRERLRDIYG